MTLSNKKYRSLSTKSKTTNKNDRNPKISSRIPEKTPMDCDIWLQSLKTRLYHPSNRNQASGLANQGIVEPLPAVDERPPSSSSPNIPTPASSLNEEPSTTSSAGASQFATLVEREPDKNQEHADKGPEVSLTKGQDQSLNEQELSPIEDPDIPDSLAWLIESGVLPEYVASYLTWADNDATKAINEYLDHQTDAYVFLGNNVRSLSGTYTVFM